MKETAKIFKGKERKRERDTHTHTQTDKRRQTARKRTCPRNISQRERDKQTDRKKANMPKEYPLLVRLRDTVTLSLSLRFKEF